MNDVERLRDLVRESKKVFVLTHPGYSTSNRSIPLRVGKAQAYQLIDKVGLTNLNPVHDLDGSLTFYLKASD